MTVGTGLRATAIAIAIVGAIDPSMSWSHQEKPVVTLLAASTPDRDLAEKTAQSLARDFTVVRRPDAAAAAIIAVGDRVPYEVDPGSTPAFAVLPTTAVAIEAVDVPERANLESRVPVAFRARVPGGVSTVEATLRVNGLVVDRQTYQVNERDARVSESLTFAPTAVGLTRVRLEVASASGRAAVDAAIDVRAERLRVLSFDPRPSYASTFVRRALEEDPRLIVTSRVSTAPRAATETGQAPSSLDTSLDGFDAIVVGAPEALTIGDVNRLEAFAKRGGAICLVMDRIASGPFERLTGSHGWTARQSPTVVAVDSGSARLGKLEAMELALPSLDSVAKPIASIGDRPVVWRVPLGSGSVTTSGALDAWRQRGANDSGFTQFWQTLVTDAAESARKPIDLRLGSRLLSPGEPMTVRMSIGDPLSASSATTRVAARIEGAGVNEPIRVWPDHPGVFVGSARAPATPGMYRVTVTGAIGNDPERTAAADLLVATELARPSETELTTAWATAHGGVAVAADRLETLDDAIARVVKPPVQVARVFPMRSGWWLPPFALGLAADWWLRRRRGLA